MISTENKQLLEGIYKSSKLGMDATELIIKKSDSKPLIKTLEAQFNEYHGMAREAGAILSKKEVLPCEASNITKLISWGSIQLNTLADTSVSNVASVMIDGSSMGIKEATKLLRTNEQAEMSSKNLCKRLIEQEQNNIERLKKFL